MIFRGPAQPRVASANELDLDVYPVKMQRWNAPRPFSLPVILGSVGLAVCVFAWGLQYKLSLYDSPQTASHRSQRIPQAKLLSRNERSGTTESPQVVRAKTSAKVSYAVPTTLFLLLAINVFNLQESRQRIPRTNHSWHLRRGLFNIFYVRPPPLLA